MKYFALLTKLGENSLAQATALGTKLELTHMAVGDGGGKLPTPDTNQTKLIAEKRRAAINTLFIDDKNKNQIIAEQIISEAEGGWWIREIGLFDKAGNLIAVANCPETYKPQLAEGSGRTQSIRMVLIVSHTESVELKVDPSVVLATREFVDSSVKKGIEEHEKSRKHPDASIAAKGLVQLADTLSADNTKAVTPKLATEINQRATDANKNANDRVPNTRKVNSKALSADISLTSGDVGAYSKIETDTKFQPKDDYATNPELKTGLDGKFDKSGVVQSTGTSTATVMSQDAVTQALQHAVDLNTIYPVGIVTWFAQNKNPNTLFPGTKWQYIGENKTIRLANSSGNNVLSSGGSDAVKLTEAHLPAHNHSFSATTSSFDYGTKTTNTTGAHTHPIQIWHGHGEGGAKPSGYAISRIAGDYNTKASGAHSHTVAIGAHTHTVSGTTGNKGRGAGVTVTNAYIMLMGWYRVS
ncbi:phage tail protein [Xenorhabdus bovienii]|uniref:phage tail-collar fiber domain-containing protein n=1 Tax=Xenorhabdus bovienii TaxID=40576 RepID=UPI001EE0FC5A|nr:phage tail protein [Xenorhabdus bovienii]MCG3471641.1 phage tail protein [Xenorhabdus bovienii]